MSGRSPARLLAPIALVLFVVAFFAVLNSGGGGGGEREEEAGRPAATAQPKTSSEDDENTSTKGRGTRTYTVKSGDTPSSIAQKERVSLNDLTNLNPEMDANTLQPGQKLKLPK